MHASSFNAVTPLSNNTACVPLSTTGTCGRRAFPKPSIQMQRKRKREREKTNKKLKQWASSTQLGAFVACLLAGMAHTGNRNLDLSLAKKGRDCSRKHFEISMKIQRSVSQCGQARTGPTEAAAQSLFSHSVLSLRVSSCRSR